MRVDCPNPSCQKKAIITSTNNLSPTVKDLYCQCTNVKGGCGMSFVMRLGYSHTLNPPITDAREMAAQILRSLPISERQALLQGDLFPG